MAPSTRLLRYVLAAVLAVSFLASAAHAQKWSRAAPFPEASEELYGVAAGGKFYAFGGLAPGWVPKGLMYEYDPAGDTWTKKKNMALALHHPAWVELNGKIYLFGGFVKPEKGPRVQKPMMGARIMARTKACSPAPWMAQKKARTETQDRA